MNGTSRCVINSFLLEENGSDTQELSAAVADMSRLIFSINGQARAYSQKCKCIGIVSIESCQEISKIPAATKKSMTLIAAYSFVAADGSIFSPRAFPIS